MTRELRCGDVMPGCNTMIEGKNDEEVMTKAVEHAKSAHNVTIIEPEVAAKIQAAIRTKN